MHISLSLSHYYIYIYIYIKVWRHSSCNGNYLRKCTQ